MTRVTVYDKAKWHYEHATFPQGLPRMQAYVHTGLFLTWIIDHDLYSKEFLEDNKEQIQQVKRREITGTAVYQREDGVLFEEMLNGEGNAFAHYYYSPKLQAEPHYLNDYAAIFESNEAAAYRTEDTWDNYARIASRINQRYREWLSAGRPDRT